MYIRINEHEFREAFREMDRLNNFSYDGLTALFDYLEELEECTGTPVELDVIGLCCDISEDYYEDVTAFYDIECGDDEDVKSVVIEYLSNHTIIVAELDDTIIYYNF